MRKTWNMREKIISIINYGVDKWRVWFKSMGSLFNTTGWRVECMSTDEISW